MTLPVHHGRQVGDIDDIILEQRLQHGGGMVIGDLTGLPYGKGGLLAETQTQIDPSSR
jgi:hypothetical protein